MIVKLKNIYNIMIKYDDFQANECCMLISCSIDHLFSTITVFYFIGFFAGTGRCLWVVGVCLS